MRSFPDFFEPIQAWRIWYARENGALTSVNNVLWYGYTPYHAICTSAVRHDHPDFSPWIQCTCGIWCFKTMKLLMESDIGTTVKNVAFAGRNPRDYSVYGGSNDTGIALGRVALWGRIVEHELGYRAEYAYPSAIVVVGSEGLTARVKKRYGCETQHDNGTIRAWLIKIRSIRGPQF